MGQNKRVSVFGGRDIQSEIYQDTIEIGERLADEGFIIFCGGGKGVMEAIAKGVHNKKGICIGILKGDSLSEMNNYINLSLIHI